jgi:hypothetical protein
MSKRSVVTVREQPVADVTSQSGAVKLHSEMFTVETAQRMELVDLTEQAMALVHRLDVQEGIVHLFSMHTTCTVFINESQTALRADILKFLERVVPQDGTYCTTIRCIRIAIGRTPIRTCARCSSAMACRCRSAAANSCSASGSAC